MKRLYFKTAAEWREWLRANHDQEDEVWLLFFKKESGEPALEYESSVEEALCFGWIDSIIKKLDDKRYLRKFTPRRAGSRWSDTNKKRVAELIAAGRMTEIGLAKIQAAKKNGQWARSDRPDIPSEVPAEFQAALDRNQAAQDNFKRLAPTYRRQYIGWIAVAKQTATKERRVREAIALLEKGEKLGLK